AACCGKPGEPNISPALLADVVDDLVAVLADQDQADDQRHRGRRPAELACAERRNRTGSITRHGWLAGRWRRVLRQLGLPRLLTGVCLLPLSLPATRLLLPPLRVGHYLSYSTRATREGSCPARSRRPRRTTGCSKQARASTPQEAARPGPPPAVG